MQKIEFKIMSEDGKTQLHCVDYRPDSGKEIIGVIQIAHGITEHIERYEDIAKYFTNIGYAVFGHDCLGHGKSFTSELNNGWNNMVEDLNSCRIVARDLHPDVPICMMGFSMGSFLVRDYLTRYPNTIDAAVLVGTGMANPIALKIGMILAKLEGLRVGFCNCSEDIQLLMFNGYNKRFKPNRTTYFDWLCSKNEVVDKYICDPWCYKRVHCNMCYELFRGMSIVCKKRKIAKTDANVPILLVSGKDDPVGDFGKGVAKFEQMLRKVAKCNCITNSMFEGRHDVLRDVDGEKALDWICKWFYGVVVKPSRVKHMIESNYRLCGKCKHSAYEPRFDGKRLTRTRYMLVCSLNKKPVFRKLLFDLNKKPCNSFTEMEI